jgi:hypothetical protein
MLADLPFAEVLTVANAVLPEGEWGKG